MKHVTIPQDRIGVLIGAGGETLREIEDRAEVRLNVDSETGSVEIESVGDPVTGLKGPDIVQAIGRGFKPEEALSLLDDEMRMFDTVDLDAATRNQNDLQRQKGRLIGENGRTRQLMEELSGASVVIYGKTLGIIGAPEEVEVVRSATEMILDGAPHGAVYSFLERRHNELQQEGLGYHRFPDGEASGASRPSSGAGASDGGEGEPEPAAETDFEIETNPEAVEEGDGVSFDEPEP